MGDEIVRQQHSANGPPPGRDGGAAGTATEAVTMDGTSPRPGDDAEPQVGEAEVLASRSVTVADGEDRAAADLAFAELCRHAARFDFATEVSRVRHLLQHGRAIGFGRVVALLGSRVAARFAVLQLAGAGEVVLLAPGALSDAMPIALAAAAGRGVPSWTHAAGIPGSEADHVQRRKA